MSDTTDPREALAAGGGEPLNDSAELRDAIRSIESIGEDRTGAPESEFEPTAGQSGTTTDAGASSEHAGTGESGTDEPGTDADSEESSS